MFLKNIAQVGPKQSTLPIEGGIFDREKLLCELVRVVNRPYYVVVCHVG